MVKSWEKVAKVGISGDKLGKMAKGGENWQKVGKSIVKSGKNGEKWLKVVKSWKKLKKW